MKPALPLLAPEGEAIADGYDYLAATQTDVHGHVIKELLARVRR